MAAGLKRIKHTDLILGGIDLNGRLPTCYQGVTGDAEFQDSDETGWRAAAALAEAGIWLPSMYSSLHCGEHATYTHPSGTSHRIDYTLVGGRATVEAARSEVDPAFDNGSPQDDHKLLRAQLKGLLDAPTITQRLRRTRYDTSKMATQEGRRLLRCCFETFPQPGWEVHPDLHCRALEDHVRATLDAEFALPKKAYTAKYVPDEVWALRAAKQGLKCRTRHRATLWLDLAARAFFQWKTREDHAVVRLVQKQGLLYGVTALAVKMATRNIRQAINTAKDAFLQSVAREGHQGAAKVLQRVKLAGLGGSKAKPKCRPLPVLLHPVDQTVAATRSQRDAVWLHHFGQQEQGEVLSVSDYLEEAMLCRYDAGCEWQISMLPCYEDITQVLRSAPKGKAAGLDCIPADALSASPNACARALLPLVLKSMLRQRQPAQWRGGVLFEAFKRSGLQSEVSNYRSLFVSNNLGKIYHRLVRNKAQEHCRDEFHGLHLGSKKRAPVAFASLYVLSCLRRCRSSKRSASILFLDTAAAYYRIIRELACGDIREDHTIRFLFHRFGLTEQDMLELLDTIQDGGMLRQAGLPGALGKIVKDIHLHTWFVTRFSDGARVCSSLAGSRPGESWADLVFAHVYSRVLHQIQEHVVAEGLGCQLAYDSQAGLYGTQGDQLLDATDATWADDSAFFTAADHPIDLLERTQRLCSLVISFCEGHGMSPNLRPGKTALVLSLVGKGLTKAKRRFFGQGEQHLRLPDLAVSIPVAEYYKHLGGYIDGRLSMTQETRYRLAQATSSYESSKALLLNNPGLSLATRTAIFASAVTPTFFNVGQWIPEGKAWTTLETGYSKLVRRLLYRDVGGDSLFRLPLPFAHWSTGCWRLALIARRARLSLLVSLAAVGPPLLWAALQEEASWCQVVQADLVWFVADEPPNWPPLTAAAWPLWVQVISNHPQRFKRHLRSRLRQSHEADNREALELLCQWHCYRTLEQRLQGVLWVMPWRCNICGRAFRTKAALSVHLFKKHQRPATYRHVAAGTRCHACHCEYWTAGRLARHLRDSPDCVGRLRQAGYQTSTIAPGIGSKERRKQDHAQFTLAPPRPFAEAPLPQVQVRRPPEQLEAYQVLCSSLFELRRSPSAADVQGCFGNLLTSHPLYPYEVLELLDLVAEETEFLQSDVATQPWAADTYTHICNAISQTKAGLWLQQGASERLLPKIQSLGSFRKLMTQYDWSARLQLLGPTDGTLDRVYVKLQPCWEAEWQLQCEHDTISAVSCDLTRVMPTTLALVWTGLLEKRPVQLEAPAKFWRMPISAPFRGARPFSDHASLN